MAFDRAAALRGLLRVPERTPNGTIRGGMGFLTHGNCVLTVAHNFYPKLPDPNETKCNFLEIDIESLDAAHRAKSRIAFADTCSDIAILGRSGAFGPLQSGLGEEEFLDFVDALQPQNIRLTPLALGEKYDIALYSEDSRWVTGTAMIDDVYPFRLLVAIDEEIPRGTSGTPIFDSNGNALGCVVASKGWERQMYGNLFSECLPGWALRGINGGSVQLDGRYSDNATDLEFWKRLHKSPP